MASALLGLMPLGLALLGSRSRAREAGGELGAGGPLMLYGAAGEVGAAELGAGGPLTL